MTNQAVFTMLADDLPELKSPYQAGRKAEWAGTTWTPTYEVSDDEGEVRSVPHMVTGDAEPLDAEMLTEVGLDADVWEVVSRRESRWQRHDGAWLQAFRLTVRRRGAGASDLTVDQMSEILRGYQSEPRAAGTTGGTMLVGVADLQAGKLDNSGSAGLVERFGRLTEDIRQHMEARGPKLDRLILAWAGDCIEGVVAQRGRLATRLDLSVTEQVRLYRRLALHQIATLAPLANEVLVATVPGNHDETYRAVDMGVNDSWAIEGMSAVSDALALGGDKYNHVKFLFPEHERLDVTFNAGSAAHPYIIGLTHGHLASSPNGEINWWKGQAHAEQPIGRAQLLLTGHFHHVRVEDTGVRKTWIQLPALDGGSAWFLRKKGEDCTAGMATLDITGAGPDWSNFRIWE
jgi:hypothetical protein